MDITVPQLAESIEEASIMQWTVKVGDTVAAGDVLAELETDKVVLEVTAPADGVIASLTAAKGATVTSGQVIGAITAGKAEAKQQQVATQPATPPAKTTDTPQDSGKTEQKSSTAPQQLVAPAADDIKQHSGDQPHLSPSARRKAIRGETATTSDGDSTRREETRTPMSQLRRRVADRLLASQHDTATLTTFNEVNMHAVMELRKRYKDDFEKQHGVRLGFMSFFTAAAVQALTRFPAVNAAIDGDTVLYRNYCDIGVAMSTERGLMVPIIRDAQQLDFAGIERAIVDFADKAKHNRISLDDLSGGTFSITNGGIFGSMLSTPILNPPQSAILGMHAIRERAVVENGQIVARPMMYLALSYDHRLIDGREAVSFLVAIKETIEAPERLLLGV